MQTVIIIIVILIVLRYIGKAIWNNQDKDILNSQPNHPSKISEKTFPIGSGTCSKRNGDRHIWDYIKIVNGEPTERFCRDCFFGEIKSWDGTWTASGKH